MDPSGLVKLLLPQIPSLSYTAVSHSLGFSAQSSKWDLRTALTVHVLRELMGSNGKKSGRKIPPVGRVQKRTLTEPGIKGKMWIAKATMGKGGAEGLEGAVERAVQEMQPGEENKGKRRDVGVEDVEVEWTGWREGAGREEGLPEISEKEKFERMRAEKGRESEVVWLYFHGGAYYLCDPRTHRALTSKLAKESGGIVCSVRYRLAPQTAFPGQLVDALLVYLSLLHPGPDSLHSAIPASNIVFAGDSAGGNLSFGLLQLLLQLHRTGTPIPFRGQDIPPPPLPAGVTANSGWFDISRSLPSITANAVWDYLPPPNHDDDATSTFPADDIWPTSPPRGDLFCDLEFLDHPLASVVLAESWETSPPLWMCTGQEMLTDEDLLVAKRAANQGVNVTLEQYEAMPHCFQLLMPTLPNAERCVRSWGQWGRKVVDSPGEVQGKGTFIPSKKGEEKEFVVREMEAVELEEARRWVRDAKERRLKGFEKEGKVMPKPAL